MRRQEASGRAPDREYTLSGLRLIVTSYDRRRGNHTGNRVSVLKFLTGAKKRRTNLRVQDSFGDDFASF